MPKATPSRTPKARTAPRPGPGRQKMTDSLPRRKRP